MKPQNLRRITALFIVPLTILSVCNPLQADSTGGFVLDHSLYARVLETYVQDGAVDYQRLKKERGDLDHYVRSIESLSREDYDKMSKNEKMAFWTNAYNAITLKVIIDHYPLKRRGLTGLAFPSNSIRQIPGVWDKITHRILGKETTLNEIEHQILRKEFRDPRIHFALVCASIGCPVLRSEPYEGKIFDSQLQDQINLFLSNPEKACYDDGEKALYLSPIFKWFGKDFEKVGGTLTFIRDHSQAGALKNLPAEVKIEWLDYDWSLNEMRKNPEGVSGG